MPSNVQTSPLHTPLCIFNKLCSHAFDKNKVYITSFTSTFLHAFVPVWLHQHINRPLVAYVSMANGLCSAETFSPTYDSDIISYKPRDYKVKFIPNIVNRNMCQIAGTVRNSQEVFLK
jgi:hypothetical protein